MRIYLFKPLDFGTEMWYDQNKQSSCGVIKMIDSQKISEERERAFEAGLPDYLKHDLDAYKEGLQTGSTIIDCLWGELYGSINMAEISDGVISPEQADYLRNKYLWR